jgi:hypothetical protein
MRSYLKQTLSHWPHKETSGSYLGVQRVRIVEQEINILVRDRVKQKSKVFNQCNEDGEVLVHCERIRTWVLR